MKSQLEKIYFLRNDLTRTALIIHAYGKIHRPTLYERIIRRFTTLYFKNKKALLLFELTRLERIIDKIDDPLYAAILRYKYIDQKSIEQIAEELNYSPRHMQRLYVQALEQFDALFKLGA